MTSLKDVQDVGWKIVAEWACAKLPKSRPARQRFALRFIAACRERADRSDEKSRFAAIAQARFAARLLIDEALGWSVELPGFPSAHDDGAWEARGQLAMAIRLAEGESPIAAMATLTVPLLLPTWIMDTLRDALDALDEGEVHDLVRPKSTGRHADAWTWDKMRLRAVQHVEFEHGKGVGQGKAREFVTAATGIATGTLAKWAQEFNETIEQEKNVKMAFKLGEYLSPLGNNKARLTDNELHLLSELLDEPLLKFGDRYSAAYGYRHNPF